MMKKTILFILFLLLFVPAAHASTVGILIDSAPVITDVAPIIENDRTLVPVRGIFEYIGAQVAWDESGVVTITAPQKTIILTIGSNSVIFNGAEKALDTQAIIKNDRTYIPLRAISGLMDCEVVWDGENKKVYIYKNTLPPVSDIYNFLYEYEVFTLVNEIRRENSLSELVWSPELASVGRRHTEDMVNRSFFDHINPDGQSPFDRMRLSNIAYMYAAENIAADYKTPTQTVDGWMNSDSHRQNILNPEFKKLGVGYYKNYWCQEFTD